MELTKEQLMEDVEWDEDMIIFHLLKILGQEDYDEGMFLCHLRTTRDAFGSGWMDRVKKEIPKELYEEMRCRIIHLLRYDFAKNLME